MNENTLKGNDQPDLSFHGELILERETPIDFHDEFDRTVMIKVYAVKEGGFVPTLEYSTNAPNEKSIHAFEMVDAMKDIECFYFVFEAAEVLCDGKGLSRTELDLRPNACRRLTSQFETFIFPLLDEIRDTATAQGYIDKPAEKKKPLWGLLG